MTFVLHLTASPYMSWWRSWQLARQADVFRSTDSLSQGQASQGFGFHDSGHWTKEEALMADDASEEDAN